MSDQPDYSKYAEDDGEGTGEHDTSGKMSPELMMYAQTLGLDEVKARALENFIRECQSSDYDDSSSEDSADTEE